MLLLSISALAVMGLCNYLVCKKLLYPPVVFCAVWATDLLIVWLAGDFFYRVSAPTLMIFVGGAFFFSLGSAACLFFWPKPSESKSGPKQKFLTWTVATLSISLPFLYRWIQGGASNYSTTENMFILARRFTLDSQEEGGGLEFNLFLNIALFSVVIAMLCFKESARSKKRAFIAITISVAMNVLIGGRSGLVILLLCCFAIHILRGGKISVKSIAAVTLALGFILGVMAVVLGKSGADYKDDYSDTLDAVKEQAFLYSAGGIVGFDQIVRSPNIIPHNWQIDRLALQVARTAGARVEVPPIHSEFLALGPNFLISNVYTMYFAYFDLGTMGMMEILFLLGFVSMYIFSRALVGHPISMMLYAMIFSGICLSVFAEYFFLGIPFMLRCAAVSWLIYGRWPSVRLANNTLRTQSP